MNAIILSVGDELVLGQTVDTNSAWLSHELATIGCAVAAHLTVADDQLAIEDAMRSSIERCDLLLVSGGIGPTPDDMTRQALATVMAAPLEPNVGWLERLEDFFHRLGREMPPTNRIQAMIPRGAELIDNSAGTAAGIHATLQCADGRRACDVLVMPGVPREMKIMFERAVLPFITEVAHRKHLGLGAVILSRTLNTFGLGESTVAERLGDLMKRDRNPSVGTTVAGGVVSLRLNARCNSRDDAQRGLDQTEAACREALSDVIFGADRETLADVVAVMLVASRKTVATAESCTGGLLAKMLTDIPGSSEYFSNGWVTYSNSAKTQRLGVSENLLNTYGAVSEPVVEAMASAARRLAKSSFALAISGVAGPTGGTIAKPVGTVCIALAAADLEGQARSIVQKRTFHFTGDRDMVRDRSAKMALAMLRFHLLKKPLPF